MKYIPILLSTQMVQARLDGRKNMTRRTKGLEIINKLPDNWEYVGKTPEHDVPYPINRGIIGNPWYQWTKSIGKSETFIAQCPYGQIGDVLWVRESFCKDINNNYVFKTMFGVSDSFKWKPSIYMPKAACRLFFEITDIRVERLQDISENDAISEGIEVLDGHSNYKNYLYGDGMNYTYVKTPKLSFCTLWKSINGEESWEANPWVWVIEFKEIEKPKLWTN